MSNTAKTSNLLTCPISFYFVQDTLKAVAPVKPGEKLQDAHLEIKVTFQLACFFLFENSNLKTLKYHDFFSNFIFTF